MSNRGRHKNKNKNKEHVLVKLLGNEICKKMLAHQMEQGNPYDLNIFLKKPAANQREGGFVWQYTPEGFNFWNDIACTINKYKSLYGRN